MGKNCRWVVLIAVVLAGCVPSLHELYTEETLIFDPAIAGTWQQEDDDYLWEFVPDAETRSYALTIVENKDKISKLTAHLVEIDGKRFFDLYPADDTPMKTGAWTALHLVRVHHFLKVEQSESNILLSAMVPQTVEALLKDKPGLVKHERLKDGLVLTDRPKGLQAFITAGLEIDKFFSDPVTLKRIASPK